MDEIILINQGNQYTFENIANMEGFEFSSTRPVIQDISGPESAIYLTSKFGRRRLSWQGVIAEDIPSSRRDLLLVARQGTLKRIRFTTCDNLALQADVEIEKVVMPYRQGRTAVLIEAVAPDWRFYSQTPSSDEFAPSAGHDVTTLGTEMTDPTFIINGPGTAFTVTNITTGKSFTITNTIISSDFIRVDVRNRLVLLNGTTSIYEDFVGDFFNLEPGDNEIAFVVTGGSGATTLEVQWSDAYVGI